MEGGRRGGSLSQSPLDDPVLLFYAQLRTAVSHFFNPESLEPSTSLQYVFTEQISVFQMLKRNGDMDRVWVVEKSHVLVIDMGALSDKPSPSISSYIVKA